MISGIDLLTFPCHTSHALQPLDVTCFKPFKVTFRAFRDNWTLNHIRKNPRKEDLVGWVACALRKGFNKENIKKRFQTTSIYPINKTTMDTKLGPSLTFETKGQKHANSIEAERSGHYSFTNEEEDLQPWHVEEVSMENIDNMPKCTPYYVHIPSDMEEGMCAGIESSNKEDCA